MTRSLDRRQTDLISRVSGFREVDRLARSVEACGFDEAGYFTDKPDPTEGTGESDALCHFLSRGYHESRDMVFNRFPDGLRGLAALDIPNREYANRLFWNIFSGQLNNEETADRLWGGIDDSLIDCIRGNGGLPYVIFGDSHADWYARRVWFGFEWLAPLPILCPGGSAFGLADMKSKSRHGPRILQWARDSSCFRNHQGIPVFLKFGGMDTEFLWALRRVQDRAYRFSIDHFDAHARRSVTRYGEFLDLLSGIIDPAHLRVCSSCPPALSDEHWVEDFLLLHRTTPERDRILTEETLKLELPDFRVRTAMRGKFNNYLRDMCQSKNLTFVDDFTPLLDAEGNVGRRYLPPEGVMDHHVDYAATTEHFLNNIRTFGPSPTRVRKRRSIWSIIRQAMVSVAGHNQVLRFTKR